MPGPAPYKTTPVFDHNTLPAAIRSTHTTKEGVWGLLRVLDGAVTLVFHDMPERRVPVTAANPCPIPPAAPHHVETDGPMRMQVEFYREPPLPGA
ncbi:MAG: hypothetical protein DI591_04145 [Citromicrobium sp.]|nr:MAG: hypothetical protein DI591_04145 [Citromicrobium sp.]